MNNPVFAVDCKPEITPSRHVPHMETIKNTAKLFGLPEHLVRQKVLSGEVVAISAGRTRRSCGYTPFSRKTMSYIKKTPVCCELWRENSRRRTIQANCFTCSNYSTFSKRVQALTL